jgi:chromate transport protein ChrA
MNPIVNTEEEMYFEKMNNSVGVLIVVIIAFLFWKTDSPVLLLVLAGTIVALVFFKYQVGIRPDARLPGGTKILK